MIVYSNEYLKHNLEGHPERKERLTSVMDFLEGKDIFDETQIIAPKSATEEDILRVHSKSHLKYVQTLSKTGTHVLGDTYFTPSSYTTAMLAAGGVKTCLDAADKIGFALVRPPGHHATEEKAMGFCIFNNAAIGAAYGRTLGYERIAVLDFDLHHGNGTQDIFYGEEILYISLHQWPHYPGTGAVGELGVGKGEGYSINIPLPAGVCDKSYNHAMEEVAYPVLKSFSPDLLIVSAGYDGHYNDPLGGLRLSSAQYLNIAKSIKGLAKKVVFTLEGGYDLEALSHCVYASLQGMFNWETELFDIEQEENKNVTDQMENNIEIIRKTASEYWAV